MKVMVQPWAISKVVRMKEKIDPSPQYQRSPVWNTARKQLLIDTILRNYDMPKFYLRYLGGGGDFEYEITDGQQRLRAIWDFVDDKYALGEDSSELESGKLVGKRYSGLSTELQDRIHEYSLSVSELQEAGEQEIRDLFLRLQEGVSLNPAEKRNAMVGGMRDFVAELGREHKVFALTNIKNKRFDWDNLAAHVTCLDLAGGRTDVYAADLFRCYEDGRGFDPDGADAQRVRRRLNLLAEILRAEPPEMNIKWGFVDLYQTIAALDSKYQLEDRADDLLQVFVSLEHDRRLVEDPADLVAAGHDSWDRDLYDYIMAFQREGAKEKNLKIRADVYMRRVHRDIGDLVPLDPKRNFTEDERLVMWRRDGGECQECGEEVDFDSMHADHILPHSKGGATLLDNGQTTCAPCNLKKGAATQA